MQAPPSVVLDKWLEPIKLYPKISKLTSLEVFVMIM